MDFQTVAILAALFATVAASLRYRPDVVAFAALMALVLVGVYSLQSALSFLIAPAVVVLFGSMVISGVIAESGLLDLAAGSLAKRTKHMTILAAALYVVAGVASGFVSDVAIVLALSALVAETAKRLKTTPVAYVLPLAFVVALGGRLTMIGNAGNVILLSTYPQTTGEEVGIFQFTEPALYSLLLAVPLFVAIAKYAEKIAPSVPTAAKSVLVRAVVGESLDGAWKKEVETRERVKILTKRRVLRRGDVLLVKVLASDIPARLRSRDLQILPLGEVKSDHMEFLIVTQRSRLVGKSLALEPVYTAFPVAVVGIVAGGPISSLETYVFKPSDELLVAGDEKAIERLAAYYRLERAKSPVKTFRPRLAASGLAGLAVAVALSQFTDTALAFIAGTFVALAGGGRAVERLYQMVSWETLIYVGSFIGIGQAVAQTGVLQPLAQYLNSPTTVFATAILATNTIGLVPSAVVLGPLITNQAALMMYILGTMPILLPFAHPAVYLVYKEAGLPLRDYLKLSALATAAAVATTLAGLELSQLF